jgi:soluble lytic murein transglycosylase-like protein
MESQQKFNPYWTKGLVWASVFLVMLLDCTPAHNLTYSHIDSKGTLHILNIPGQTIPTNEPRHFPQSANREKDPVSLTSATSQSVTEAMPARIARTKDPKGIFHITNATSAPEGQQTSSLLAVRKPRKRQSLTQQANSFQILPTGEGQPGNAAQVSIHIADSPVAGAQVAAVAPANSETPLVASSTNLTIGNELPTYRAAETGAIDQLTPVAGNGGVNRMALFIDQQGKVFIYQAKVEAADSPASENKMFTGKAEVASEAFAAVAAQSTPLVEPVSMQGNLKPEGGLQKIAKRSKVWSNGRIRVFRDRQGYTHIVNSPGRESQLARAESPKPEMPRITYASATSPPCQNVSVALTPPETYQDNLQIPVGLDNSFSRVMVFKDKQGKLNISNSKIKATDYAWLAWETKRFAGKAGDDLEMLMAEAAQQNRLPLPLVKAVIRAESGFTPGAVSCKGAMGLMQLMPTTAAFLGVKNPFCPQENVMAGCRYLRDLLDTLNGSVALALAAYNAGLQRVINSGYQVPAIAETQDFVDKVLRYFFSYQQQVLASSKI